MSVRAYRMEHKTIKGRVWSSHAQSNTFNCWHDTDLNNFLRNHEDTSDQTNSEGGGVICVSLKALKQAIKKQKELKYDDDVLKKLKEDLEIATKEGEEYIDYDCF